jgi:tRNA(adenine34) deaminase
MTLVANRLPRLNGNKTVQDSIFMQAALEEAQKAADADEVPVGAVLVLEGQVIARGHNQMITRSDPSAHAEMQALRQGGLALQNYRLYNTSLYVTLEPCIMCFGALVHARIARLVFATPDPKTGVCGSCCEAAQLPLWNHRFEIVSGILQAECATLLTEFFQQKRGKK